MVVTHLDTICQQGLKLIAIFLASAALVVANVVPASAYVPPKYFIFDNLHSWLCLDVVDWGSYEGANVQQWGCNRNEAQQWEILYSYPKYAYGKDGVHDAWYEIVNRANHRCLAVADRSEADGANVIVEDCDAGANQYWAVGYPRAGTISLRALHSNKCLDVAHMSKAYGANVQQWTCWNGPNQNWYKRPL